MGCHITLREPPSLYKKPTLSHVLCSTLRGNLGCNEEGSGRENVDGEGRGGVLAEEEPFWKLTTQADHSPGCRPCQQSLLWVLECEWRGAGILCKVRCLGCTSFIITLSYKLLGLRGLGHLVTSLLISSLLNSQGHHPFTQLTAGQTLCWAPKIPNHITAGFISTRWSLRQKCLHDTI